MSLLCLVTLVASNEGNCLKKNSELSSNELGGCYLMSGCNVV